MFEFVCLAGMAFGSFWGFSNYQPPVNTEKGLLGGAAIGTGAGALIGRGTPGAVVGGAVGANTPSVTRPSPYYLGRSAPQYFPPSEPYPYPLPKELRSLEEAAKEVYDDIVGSSKTTPVPARPIVADAIQDRLVRKDSRMPIMPPIKSGERPTCDDPPEQAEILRALSRVQPGLPYIYQVYRDDVEYTVEKMVDRIDAPRFFPLIGQAQMHHCHWKCTVYFTETIEATYPWPFRVQRKRAEVVYIDKDRLYMCERAPSTAAEPNASCPAGCASAKTVASSRAKAAGVEQVQLDVVVAKLNRSALPKETYRWAEKQFGFNSDDVSSCVVKDQNAGREFLQALRRDGCVQVLAEPRLITLSGRPGHFMTGGEMPVTTEANSRVGVSYEHIGVMINFLPIVQANGKIHLEVRPEISSVEKNPATKINRRSFHVGASIETGQTLAIRGFTDVCKSRVLILGELPFVGKLFEQETEHELLILVTPRLVSAAQPVAQAGHTEECEPASKPKQVRRAQMTVNDVVRMAQKNIAEDIILRQMELTNAMFNLSVDDIIELHDAGVNATIIRAMQERYEENATQGTVYSSIAIDRMTEKMIDSESLRQLHDEWRRFWSIDLPSHLTPNRTPAAPSIK